MHNHPRLRHLTTQEKDALAELVAWLQEHWGDRIARYLRQSGALNEETDYD